MAPEIRHSTETSLQCLSTINIVFSDEGRILIKKVCIWRGTEQRGWQTNFLTKAGESVVLTSCWKSCETGTVDRRPVSSRPCSVHTEENMETVNDLALSQEDKPQTHRYHGRRVFIGRLCPGLFVRTYIWNVSRGAVHRSWQTQTVLLARSALSFCFRPSCSLPLTLYSLRIKRCSRSLHHAICLHFLPYVLNTCIKFEFLISQDSVATFLRWGGQCCMGFVANFIRFPAVQKFWTSVKIWQSYRQLQGGNFSETQYRYIEEVDCIPSAVIDEWSEKMESHTV